MPSNLDPLHSVPLGPLKYLLYPTYWIANYLVESFYLIIQSFLNYLMNIL